MEKTDRGAVLKRIAVLVAPIVVALSFASAALADSPHFVRASASGPADDGSLAVSWKEAGLGTNQLVDYVASADASASFACINGGGNHPQAANKETVNGPVSAEGTFASGKNGQVTASLTVLPPGPGGFGCPNGQRLVLVAVSYTNVAISDTSNGVAEPVAGTFARTFFDL